jgi:predicted nucleic acid-binding protein
MTNSLICCDASLGLKLFLPEDDSALARSLWEEWKDRETTIIAPTLWAYEVTSVLRNRVHRGRLAPEQEADLFAAIHELPVQLVRPAGLHRRAWELARHFDLPAAYDAHYLALAEMASCPFWTADERLFNVVHGELGWVSSLNQYRPTSP